MLQDKLSNLREHNIELRNKLLEEEIIDQDDLDELTNSHSLSYRVSPKKKEKQYPESRSEEEIK